jgi:CDGSH-type Zn-finger protein
MTTIKVRDDGPYLIEGDDVRITDAEGSEILIERRPFALCRCGASKQKPFCDGAHRQIEFKASCSDDIPELETKI